MCSKQTNENDQSKVKTLTVNEIGTPRSKEPEQNLEDEFKDLHLNLLVLEVLAHAPMYNVILDKYELEELIEKKIDLNRPLKEGHGAWHAKIRLIDPDGEEFTKTFQIISTTRKLSEEYNPSEIIDLDHFYDSMATLFEDIQRASFDTRPPMLDRSTFESWQQRICLYCLGKENGENILQSIDEGPFKMGKFRETLAEGVLHQRPERDRVFFDLTPEETKRYKADIRATNILLQGLPKDIYTLINHYTNTKDIWDNVKMLLEVKLNRGLKTSNYDQLYAYLKQHEAHANENKMMLERYNQHAIDPLAFVSNVLP
uniref:Integrase, catalytic region, zinc finger, CCHC-type, peptidase aspartic, catalytic n=1 Tax=Tanacetum cinerariifolium TaxID=118510 RepID=A0A6L2JXM4_TANCI|nr:integrase, catalytic region, zinc finger, CCHC-type, peptidase aspartic, catalytic [Tanacetum cinerariifolium]